MGEKAKKASKKESNFLELMKHWTYRLDASDVFDCLLTISLTQFAAPECEWSKASHLAATKRLIEGPKDIEIINSFFVSLIKAYEDGIEKNGKADVWGEIYEEIRSKWKASGLGQFFTPFTLCDILASHAEYTSNGKMINDPTCGSGRILLSSHSKNLPESLGAYYIGEDIDLVCVKMCTFNFLVHGLVGEVINHDTLRYPNSWALRFKTHRHPSGLLYYTTDTKKETEPKKVGTEQMSLF